MVKLNLGVKTHDDDDEVKQVKVQRTNFNADRQRSDAEKGLDDALFGSGAVRGRRPPNPPANPQGQLAKTGTTVVQEKKVVQKQETVTTNVTSITKTTEVRKDVSRNEITVKTSTNLTTTNNAEKKPLEENRGQRSGRLGFNRPSYIRKLKKIAQNFEFDQINSSNHTYYDIVRPYETNRSKVLQLQAANSSEGSFQDKEFPATAISVGRNYRKANVEWKRADEWTQRTAFGKYVEPNDIEAGKFSCPSFLSVVSCLAERQRNIKRLIESQQYNPNGFYYVRLNINSVWRYLAVDDFLPTIDGDNVGALSFRDSESDIAVSLIEKAYAKAYGGYDVFEKKARPEDYLRDLTGSRVAKYSSNDSELAQNVRFGLEQEWTCVAVPNSRIEELGLSSGYNLSIIGVSSRGFELRNSWGTTVQRPKINFSKEGVFELSFAEATKYFDYILIAETDDRLLTSTVQSKHHRGFYSTYRFRISSQVQGVVSVNQWDLRLFPNSSNYQYSPFRVIIDRHTSSTSSEYVAGGYTFDSRNLDLLVNLTPGEYSITAIGSWAKGSVYDYTVTLFGSHSVRFDRKDVETFPNLISQCLQRVNLETGKRSAKGHVDQYILYHEPTNLVLLTNLNVSEKSYDYTQDLSKVSFDTLTLLNAPNGEENFSSRLEHEIARTKSDHNSDRRWSIALEPKSAYTWVISSSDDYNPNNLKTWGFR